MQQLILRILFVGGLVMSKRNLPEEQVPKEQVPFTTSYINWSPGRADACTCMAAVPLAAMTRNTVQ